ncbi:MAG: S-layer homology domain-containing protein [Clostridia bacterium]|nr:S-layer homology domain-containing protein [Clostridia bacterium]
MNRKTTVRAITFLIALLMCLYSLPLFSNGAYSYESARPIINSQKLYPQKTGFTKIDNRVAELLKSFRSKSNDTYELLLNCYDWLVYNVTYESNLVYNPDYDFNSKYKCPVPYYVIEFAYEPLFEYEGVCDNFASAMVLFARAIGLDAYVRTGHMVLRNGTVNSHTWCEIVMDGVSYIYDPQADNSVYKRDGKNRHYYFGPSASSMASTYVKNTSKSAAYEAAHTPVSEPLPQNYCKIGWYIGGNGSITTNATSRSKARSTARSALWNSKNYSHQFTGFLDISFIASKGAQVTLTAIPDEGESFKGWYVNNLLVSSASSYTFYPEKDTYVEALFSGDRFRDVKKESWYYDQVYYCFNSGLMSGMSVTTFAPSEKVTRAMVVSVLGKMIGVNTASYTDLSFSDVRAGSWYAPYVDWAKKSGITSGYNSGVFGTHDHVTREQLAVFFYKFAAHLKYNTGYSKDLSVFSDASAAHDWALPGLRYAYGIGLLTGKNAGILDPRGEASRAELAAMVKRFRSGS